MYDPTITADDAARWTYLDVDLPRPLKDAINAYEAIRYAEVDDRPVFDAASVTAENAEQKVREFAQSLALTMKGTTGFSPLAEARKAALQVSARAVNARAGEAVPAIIESLSPQFDEAVTAFRKAVNYLPDELTSDALVSSGPNVFAQFQTAREQVRFIHRVAEWVATLTDFPAYAGVQPAGILRVLAPATRSDVHELVDAHDRQGEDPRVSELGAEYLYAVRNGIEFKINDPRQSAELLDKLSSLPVEKRKYLTFR